MNKKDRTASPMQTDSRLILLNPKDNVLGVARPIRAGEKLIIEGEAVVLDQHAGMGFKIARHDIANGTPILKYAAKIGVASMDIAKGQLVHVHNLRSTYMANTVTTSHDYKKDSSLP